MSSQKGNVTRSRPQRHQNTFSFKNDKFDKSVQTKQTFAKDEYDMNPSFRNEVTTLKSEKRNEKMVSTEVSNQWCFNYSNQLFSKEKHIIPLQAVLPVAKKINAKLHDGVCQRCKEVLEWRVKYSKYKPLSKPKKCVKCLQKTVKDSYHIMCRPCACELEVCAKCGKREDVVIPFNKEPEKTENVENNSRSSNRRSCRRNEGNDDDLDFDIDLDDTEEDN